MPPVVSKSEELRGPREFHRHLDLLRSAKRSSIESFRRDRLQTMRVDTHHLPADTRHSGAPYLLSARNLRAVENAAYDPWSRRHGTSCHPLKCRSEQH